MSSSIQLVATEKSGQRIDNFLFTGLKGVPKSLVYRLLRTGKIRVNGKRVKQTYRLQAEDKVLIPNIRLPWKPDKKPDLSSYIQARIESSILYEDESVLVLDKPAGIAVHSGTRVVYGVIEALRVLRPTAPYLELVHRLDRETSGCLLIAKNKGMLDQLHELLRTRKIQKTYLALVKGKWELGEKTVNTPLKGKVKSSRPPIKSENHDGLKAATTKFTPDRVYRRFSLMRIQPGTGRMHQIRIHASQIGYPIAGDQKYGDFTLNRECKRMGLKRMFLHASNISFQCLEGGKRYDIMAPLEDDLKGFLELLESDG